MDKKKMLATNARMEGEQVILANIGKRIKVSQMELVCLATFAEIGLMSVFSSLEGKDGEDAQDSLDKTINAVRREFSKESQDGLIRLAASTSAMLRGRKFGGYVTR